MSNIKASIPHAVPQLRATLVAPVLPLPYSLMSIPLDNFPISKPKEIEATM